MFILTKVNQHARTENPEIIQFDFGGRLRAYNIVSSGVDFVQQSMGDVPASMQSFPFECADGSLPAEEQWTVFRQSRHA
jgi:hypothetical protein